MAVPWSLSLIKTGPVQSPGEGLVKCVYEADKQLMVTAVCIQLVQRASMCVRLFITYCTTSLSNNYSAHKATATEPTCDPLLLHVQQMARQAFEKVTGCCGKY